LKDWRLSEPSHSISVIVPVHYGGKPFAKCLFSLVEASPPPEEIIIVADGDTDNSWREAEKLGIRVIREPVAGGPAKARNRGAREASGEILLFIDADVAIPAGLIGQVAEIFEREPDLAAVIGSYDDAPPEANFFSQYKNLVHHYTHQQAKSRGFTFWGACGAIRRHIFLEAGGFDESYHQPSIEDIELGYRLQAAGCRIRLEKSLHVKHLKRWEMLSLLKSDFFCRALPWTELILRYGKLPDDLNLQRSSRISVIAVYGLVAASIGAFFHSALILLSLAFLALILVLNVSLLRFFYSKHGLSFAIKAMMWHCFYYLYSGLAFAIGIVLFRVRKRPTKIAATA
jgi:GT2 family glycosyltransferase